MDETQVLVVGGGIAGLTAALLLDQHGIDALLVERHHEAAPQPKARRFNLRSMEVYRSLGVTDQIEKASAALAHFDGMLHGTTLATATWPTLAAGMSERRAEIVEHSPCDNVLCPQNLLEPALRTAAEERSAELRFDTELVAVTQDADGVTAQWLDRTNGERYAVHADYLIAADGARSPVREALGIRRGGIGHLTDNLDVYFEADLTELIGDRRFNLCAIDNPAASGAFLSINGTDRWLFSTSDFEVHSEAGGGRARDLDDARWVELLRTLIDAADLPIRIISATPWESAMRVAETFSLSRVFLAGDAAHAMPPMAAAGANTAIQDVHNLIWKLSAVLRGNAPATLLDTYHAERYPIDYATAEFSSQVAGHVGTMIKTFAGVGEQETVGRPETEADTKTDDEPETKETDDEPAEPVMTTTPALDFNPWVGLLGTQYEEGALIPDGRGPGPMDRLVPEGRTGIRAPHVWVHREAERISTIDLAGPGFALLTGQDGADWLSAAAEVGAELGLSVHAHRIGPDAAMQDADNRWQTEVGIKSDGALLVRPDGIVAWRSVESVADPAGTLREVLETVLTIH